MDKSPYLFTDLLDIQFRLPSLNDHDYLDNLPKHYFAFISLLHNKISTYYLNNVGHCYALIVYAYEVPQ